MRIGKGPSAVKKTSPKWAAGQWATGLVLAWGLSTAAVACDAPATTVEVPDGRTATEEQMAIAQQAVQAYVGEAEAYIACLEGSGMAAAQVRRLRDQSIDEMERHAAQFNRQLRHFRNQ